MDKGIKPIFFALTMLTFIFSMVDMLVDKDFVHLVAICAILFSMTFLVSELLGTKEAK